MKELTRTKRLRIASLIFILIIALGFITLKKPKYEFKISPQQMGAIIADKTYEVYPDPSMKTMNFNDAGMIMVDVRYPSDYSQNHLGDAMNIPVSDILLDDNIQFFDQWLADSMMVVLYSQNQLEANGPWMLLQQLGYSNVSVLLGGMNCLNEMDTNSYYNEQVPSYLAEEPKLDFGAYITGLQKNSGNNNTIRRKIKNIIPIKRKKKNATEGGC